jgi:hypothetical protein
MTTPDLRKRRTRESEPPVPNPLRVPEAKRGYLLDHPQPLGFLPTRWFWNDPENWRLVRWGYASGLFAMLLIAMLVFSNFWLVWMMPIAAAYLGFGLLERYIRRRAMARRHEDRARACSFADDRRSFIIRPLKNLSEVERAVAAADELMDAHDATFRKSAK